MKKDIITYLPIGILTGITLVSGGVLTSAGADAVNPDTANASVTVSADACGFTNEQTSSTVALSADSGQIVNTESISTKPSMTVACNDTGGFKIYAVGNSPATAGGEATLGQTGLVGTSGTIATGTATTGNTSSWAMKISSVTSNSNTSFTTAQGDFPITPYTTYQSVPSEYALILAAYGLSTSNTTATIRTDYQVYASPVQAAGTYTGGVAYKIVNPTSATAPSIND